MTLTLPDLRESRSVTTVSFLLGLEGKVLSITRGSSRVLELGPTSTRTTRNFLRARLAWYRRTSLSVDSSGSLDFSFWYSLMQVWLLTV